MAIRDEKGAKQFVIHTRLHVLVYLCIETTSAANLQGFIWKS